MDISEYKQQLNNIRTEVIKMLDIAIQNDCKNNTQETKLLVTKTKELFDSMLDLSFTIVSIEQKSIENEQKNT